MNFNVSEEAVVIVVDDSELIRKTMENLFRSVGLDVRTYASISSLEKHVDSAARGCIILDMRLPDVSGLSAVERVRSTYHGLEIIGISGFADARLVVKAMRAGVVDFFDKPFSRHELLESVQLILQHQLIGPVAHPAGRSEAEYHRLLNTLTRRQKAVLEHFASGKDEKEIASKLNLHLRTVQRHLRNALTVLDVPVADRQLIQRLVKRSSRG